MHDILYCNCFYRYAPPPSLYPYSLCLCLCLCLLLLNLTSNFILISCAYIHFLHCVWSIISVPCEKVQLKILPIPAFCLLLWLNRPDLYGVFLAVIYGLLWLSFFFSVHLSSFLSSILFKAVFFFLHLLVRLLHIVNVLLLLYRFMAAVVAMTHTHTNTHRLLSPAPFIQMLQYFFFVSVVRQKI